MKFPVVSSLRHLSNVTTETVLLGLPVPPLVDVMALVVLLFVPPDVTCTETLMTQLPPAAIVPPLKVSVVSPARGVNAPPQASVAFGGVVTTSPPGSGAVTATP